MAERVGTTPGAGHPVQGCKRIHRPQRHGSLGIPQHHIRLVQPRNQPLRGVGHHDLPLGRAPQGPRRHMRRNQRPRQQHPPRLLEDEHRLRQPEPHPALLLGEPQREEPGRAELPPQLPVQPPGVHGRPERLPVEETREQLPYPLPQRPLVLGESEVHGGGHRPFGRPRMRSATMLRWIWEVPAAIVYESEDSRSRVQSRPRSSASGPRTAAAASYSSWRACE